MEGWHFTVRQKTLHEDYLPNLLGIPSHPPGIVALVFTAPGAAVVALRHTLDVGEVSVFNSQHRCVRLFCSWVESVTTRGGGQLSHRISDSLEVST